MRLTQKNVCCIAWLAAASLHAAPAEAPLADAVEAMDRSRIRALMADPVDVNAPQADGTTALHWAAQQDDLETARVLVKAGANVNAVNRYGVAPLNLACTNGNGDLIDMLLNAGADANATLPGGETALMTASRTGRLGPVRALLAHGARVDGKVHGMGRREGAGANAFNRRLYDPTIFDFETRPEQTALVWAAAEGHAEVVSELIKAGADFKTPLASGFTPLLFAVRNGHIDAVKVLIAAGVDVNERINPDKEWRHTGYSSRLRPDATALHVAVENGRFELAAYLLEAGADPNAADQVGYTALHAIPNARRMPAGDADPPPERTGSLASLDLVRELAKHGADLNARMSGPGLINLGVTVLGPTAFLAAAQKADVDFMETLIELGADPLIRDDRNRTALMLAGAQMGTDDEVLRTMELTLEAGVDINAVDDQGETAMHAAAYRDRGKPIRLLAGKGADIRVWNRANKSGATPLAIAVGYRGGRIFRPQPEAEAAIRDVMFAAGLTPPERVSIAGTASP